MAMAARYLTVNGEILSEKRNAARRDYLPDPLGSTAALLDSSQSKTDTFTYWPYGETRTAAIPSGTPFQFVGTLGYYTDAGSHRVYVRARIDITRLGRWLTVDPLWPNEDAYAYARFSPALYADVSGKKVQLCRRPVVADCLDWNITHWFLRTTQCGDVGYGLGLGGGVPVGPGVSLGNKNDGVVFGNQMGDAKELRCMDLPYDFKVESCLCQKAKNAARGWRLCGIIWTGACYNFETNNCQHFIQALIVKCTGRRITKPMIGGPPFRDSECKENY